MVLLFTYTKMPQSLTLLAKSTIWAKYKLAPFFSAVAVLSILVTLMPIPAQARWQDDIGIFKVGIIAGDDNLGTIRRAEPFRAALSLHLDVPVEIVPFKDWVSLIGAQVSGSVQYAIHSALSFAVANTICGCVDPLASPTFQDGSKGLHAIILAHSDGPERLEDLQKATLGIFSKDDFVTFDFARAVLLADGFNTRELNTVFLQINSPEMAIDALKSGTVKALLGWSTLSGDVTKGYSQGTLTDLLAIDDKVDLGSIKVIWKSDFIPNGAHAIINNMPDSAKSQIQNFLLGLAEQNTTAFDSISPLFSGGFQKINPSQFDSIRMLLDEYDKNKINPLE